MIFNRRTLLHGMGAAMGAAWVLPKLANAQDSKVLRIAARNDFQSLDPAFSSTVAESDIQDSLYVRLISYDGVSWNTQLDAATSIEQVDPTHIRFALRPGIAWTNGFGEVSAEDVKYSFERIANPEMGFSIAWTSPASAKASSFSSNPSRRCGARPCRGMPA
jgi:peptide/nickel transport system substrate-binding protein